MEAESATNRPPVRNAPWLVRAALAWSHLLAALSAVRVLASTGGWLPATALAPGWFGLGNLSAAGVVLSGVGLAGALVAWRGSRWWRRFVLVGLLLVHLVGFAVFPPRWLLACLRTDAVRFFASAERPLYGLTIDDGLDPVATPRILDALARHDARATFFVLGATLEEHPELALRCLREGHELANHQMTDTPAVALEPEALRRSMRQADSLLRDITTPRWFRPGGGIATDEAKAVAVEIGCPIVLGSVFPFDSHLASARFTAAYLEGRAGPGEIVVLHDGDGRGERTAAALEAALPRLKARGLQAVTLSELLTP